MSSIKTPSFFFLVIRYTEFMKIKFLILFICFLFPLIADAKLLKATVVYTPEQAKQIAFEGVQKKIDMSPYSEYFFDKDYELHQKMIKKKKKYYHWHSITVFLNDNSYAFKNSKINSKIVFYYNNDGYLEFIDFIIEKKYPRKKISYTINGQLDRIVLDLKHNESYIFGADGDVFHWIGNNCYNDKGEIVSTRY